MLGIPAFTSQWQRHGITYTRRPRENWQFMALGNGDIGASVWFADDGVHLLLQKNDAWRADGSLAPIAEAVIALPLPGHDVAYRQTLTLQDATIRMAYDDITVSLWADAHANRIYIDCAGVMPEVRLLPLHPEQQASGVRMVTSVITDSPLPASLAKHNLAEAEVDDFYLYRACGASVQALDGVIVFTVASAEHDPHGEVLAAKLTIPFDPAGLPAVRAQHEAWWQQFWARSYIEIDSDDPDLQQMEAAWWLHRYHMASSSRGQFPTHFEGGLFLYTPLPRNWDKGFWIQNTRLLYWPLLRSGDLDLFRPWFDLFRRALPAARQRVRHQYGHGGAIVPETFAPWGGYTDADVHTWGPNPYITHYFTGSLEVLAMMCVYAEQADDADFRAWLPEFAAETLRFFSEHYGRGDDGRLLLDSSSALETWWNVRNSGDQTAGLMRCLADLIRLGEQWQWDTQLLDEWRALAAIVPPLPVGRWRIEKRPVGWRFDAQNYPGTYVAAIESGDRLIPGEFAYDTLRRNDENPELYAVWPFRIHDLTHGDVELGRRTWHARMEPAMWHGWDQDTIQAAALGMTDEAVAAFREHLASNYKFPGGMATSPGYGNPERPELTLAPYVDTLGAMAMALEEMLLHDGDDGPIFLPAWPNAVSVRFRLHTRRHGVAEYDGGYR